MIKLPSTVDDYGFLLQEDYESCIEAAIQSEKERGTDAAALLVVQRFKERVQPQCRGTSITHKDLLKLLGTNPQHRTGPADVVTDRHVSLLLSTGLLTRQVGDQSSYLFAIAGAGRLISSITKGRKEILAGLARKRYKEAFVRDIEKWKLRGSCLDVRWHLRDLLGRGHILQVHTTSGPLIQLVKKEH